MPKSPARIINSGLYLLENSQKMHLSEQFNTERYISVGMKTLRGLAKKLRFMNKTSGP